MSWRRRPTFMPCTPGSQLASTRPAPSTNASGSPRAQPAHPGGGASFDARGTMLDDRGYAVIEVAVQSLAVPGGTPGLTAVVTALAAAEDNAAYPSRRAAHPATCPGCG